MVCLNHHSCPNLLHIGISGSVVWTGTKSSCWSRCGSCFGCRSESTGDGEEMFFLISHLRNEKDLGCSVFSLGIVLSTHDTWISIKQPVFHRKYPAVYYTYLFFSHLFLPLPIFFLYRGFHPYPIKHQKKNQPDNQVMMVVTPTRIGDDGGQHSRKIRPYFGGMALAGTLGFPSWLILHFGWFGVVWNSVDIVVLTGLELDLPGKFHVFQGPKKSPSPKP